MTTRTERLIDAAWKKISQAVSAGLKEKDDASLSQICTVVKRTGDLHDHVQLGWGTATPGNTDGVLDPGSFVAAGLIATPGRVYQLSARCCLPVSGLDPALVDTQHLTEWAETVRRVELRWVMDRLLDGAVTQALLSEDTEMPDRSRLIVFATVENLELWARSKGAELRVMSGLAPQAGFPAALSFPADATAVSRLEPFELSWDSGCSCTDPEDQPHVTLSLTERIEFVRAPEAGVVTRFDVIGTFPPPPTPANAQPTTPPG